MANTLFNKGQMTEFQNKFTNNYQISQGNNQLRSIDTNVTEEKLERLKVAAYCRVSTDQEIQDGSLQNQIIHYTNHIRANPNWYFAGIYSDKGKSGTNITNRSGFRKLIKHSMEDKIDIILCKSVSRFARNVTDTIDKIRMLSENNVKVIFERENLDTSDMKSEFIMTLLAAVAQEESRSISENVRWSLSKRYERGEGKFVRLLGYALGENKEWEIIDKEARIVREAFDLCIKGESPAQIARIFVSKGYKTSRNREDWSGAAIRDILRNERYIGDVLCQKTYVKDYLEHRSRRNNGLKDQYLIQDHHQPIIDKVTYEKAQNILCKRTKAKQTSTNKKSYPFSGRIACGSCGGNLQRYICRGIVTWRCGMRMKSKSLCQMQGVKEENIIKGIDKAFREHYDFSNPKTVIREMISDLKNVEFASDTQQCQLRLELERALFQENIAIMKLDDSEVQILKAERMKIEKELEEKQKWSDLIDLDEHLRKNALSKLNKILRMKNSLELLEKELEKIEFLRAWVVRVEALSPFCFNIKWIDDLTSEVNITKGDENK